MFDDLNELYQQVILDHSKSPRNFHKLEQANRVARGHNPLCGDQITVYLLLNDGVIQDISWQGSGCAISKASASLMTAALKGKTEVEAKELFTKFHQMALSGRTQDIGKLSAFAGVHKFPARVKCAVLSWHAVASALEGKNEPVSTE